VGRICVIGCYYPREEGSVAQEASGDRCFEQSIVEFELCALFAVDFPYLDASTGLADGLESVPGSFVWGEL
jgi:hypothetical protein